MILSKNNHFTNPFYLFRNFSINIFPWTIPSIVGFLKHRDLIKFQGIFYFITQFYLALLSLFSTKTPYYPIQILSLISINTFIGIQYFIENNENNIIFLLRN